ncbi:LPXTG cell wall anchor domain-containing protein [Micromonospora endolithica]|uniref:LPXTG cell wall anchor domain-containing protein n=1 Tax=Micromonospora endolithica TaxID=230091 RepID=A0A3A9ZDX8_9ACTN|nr:LPXTG cell wall anchor domain-containing protein [Micromonospora endolithica]RKN46468.1 LPXTG cell wall anchor domain-containing protein [Micromonospora endolithica]TWJ24776.1 LPXTG-motif cell wall-anchored protein [Micromonospora endolithica]
MLTHSTRRWLAGLGVAGALVAASAGPAVAQESDVDLAVYFPDVTIAADSAGKVEYPTVYSSAPVVLHDLTVRYDYTALAGKVTVTDEDNSECTTPEANVLVCTLPYEVGIEDEWGTTGLFEALVAPTEDAADGVEGALKVSVSAKGFDSVSYESRVRVGEGVDLAAGPETTRSAAPGAKFTAPLAVRNVGETTAKGAAVVFYNDHGIRADKKYSNCTYVDDELRTCRFDEALAPGAGGAATLAYALGKDTFAPGSEWGEIIWMTPAEFEDFEAYLNSNDITIGTPGTGGDLDLAVSAASARVSARGSQADTQPDNNATHLEVKVTGKNSTDLEAIGAKLAGGKGAEVPATIGFRNNGPATLDYGRSGSSVTHMEVEVPKGTYAAKVSDWCFPVKGEEWGEPGEPGARKYSCYTSSFVKAGEQETFDFVFRIDEVIANAAGTVKINVPCECDGGFYQDLKPANDTAKILVNATGNGGGEGGGDGDDPTLPITGANTALFAGLGAVLLAAGAAGFVVARRRRMRFVA